MSKFFATPVRDASTAIADYFVPANAPFSCVVKKGESVRIVDLEGQQAVDTPVSYTHLTLPTNREV